MIVRRRDAFVVPLARPHLDRYLEDLVSAGYTASAVQDAQADFERFPGPRFMPAYSELLVDDSGLLWVGDYRSTGRVWDLHERAWTVIDTTGSIVARAITPPGLRIHHIGERFVVGRSTDSLGVHYVVVHELSRQ